MDRLYSRARERGMGWRDRCFVGADSPRQCPSTTAATPVLGRIAWATTDLVNGETVIMRASEGKNAMRFRTMSPYPPSLFRHPLGNLQLCRILVRFWTATDARARGIFLFVVLVFFFWANWKYRTRRIVANDLRCQKESPRHFLICGLSLRQLSSFAHACAAQNPLRAEHADN